MLKLTEANLKKLEDLFKQLQYKVRYEKGQFQAGYCLVKSQKVIVINKFYTTEARINCLLEILQQTEIDKTLLLEESMQKFLDELLKDLSPISTKADENIVE